MAADKPRPLLQNSLGIIYPPPSCLDRAGLTDLLKTGGAMAPPGTPMDDTPVLQSSLVIRNKSAGNALSHHLLHPLILRLLVLCAPAVLGPRALQDAPAPADSNF